jgi:hypothetical protein
LKTQFFTVLPDCALVRARHLNLRMRFVAKKVTVRPIAFDRRQCIHPSLFYRTLGNLILRFETSKKMLLLQSSKSPYDGQTSRLFLKSVFDVIIVKPEKYRLGKTFQRIAKKLL